MVFVISEFSHKEIVAKLCLVLVLITCDLFYIFKKKKKAVPIDFPTFLDYEKLYKAPLWHWLFKTFLHFIDSVLGILYSLQWILHLILKLVSQF